MSDHREEIRATLRIRAEQLEREAKAMRAITTGVRSAQQAAADFGAAMKRIGSAVSGYRVFDEGQDGARAVDPLPHFERAFWDEDDEEVERR